MAEAETHLDAPKDEAEFAEGKPATRKSGPMRNQNGQPKESDKSNAGDAPSGVPTMRQMKRNPGEAEMDALFSSTETLTIDEGLDDITTLAPPSLPGVPASGAFVPPQFGYVLQAPGMVPQPIAGMGLQPYPYSVQNAVFLQAAPPMGPFPGAGFEGVQYASDLQTQGQQFRRYPVAIDPRFQVPQQFARQTTLVNLNAVAPVEKARQAQRSAMQQWSQPYNPMASPPSGYGMAGPQGFVPGSGAAFTGMMSGMFSSPAARRPFPGENRREGQQERKNRASGSSGNRSISGGPSVVQGQLASTGGVQGGVCRFFRQGHCKFEDRCRYSHDMARAPGDSFAQFQGPGSSYPGIGIAYNPSGMPMPYAMQPQYAAPFQGSGFGMGAPAHGRQRSDGSHHHGHKSRQASEEARFVNAEVSTFVGEIHNLCKDQFGCRFLQRKLEEGAGNDRELIFTEVYDHFNDLMTDPFGNYLCQKMIEVATDAQKSTIVDKVGPELVNISLNMHGTRAVQKLIENLTLPAHIRVAVNYMSQSVVTLIKDLNGNHVIQKCLKTLLHEDNEFIFRAVTDHCLEVACHKHGCCVLQRCLDDSSEVQKELLVREITYHALQLVKDQFGNYVVQYVLDLGDPTFVLPMLRQFVNFVPELSMQKHSSNAIEKSIKIADPEMRSTFIGELLAPERFELLVRDQYANFVIQTALEYADPFQRRKLIELITPLLQAMRSTPFGKRITSRYPSEFPILDTSFPGFPPATHHMMMPGAYS